MTTRLDACHLLDLCLGTREDDTQVRVVVFERSQLDLCIRVGKDIRNDWNNIHIVERGVAIRHERTDNTLVVARDGAERHHRIILVRLDEVIDGGEPQARRQAVQYLLGHAETCAQLELGTPRKQRGLALHAGDAGRVTVREAEHEAVQTVHVIHRVEVHRPLETTANE
jgi:hypothetical protein